MVRKKRKFEKSRRKSIWASEAIIAAESKHNNKHRFQMLRIQLNHRTRKKSSTGHFHDRNATCCLHFPLALLTFSIFFAFKCFLSSGLKLCNVAGLMLGATSKCYKHNMQQHAPLSLSHHSALQRSIVGNLWALFFLFHPQCVVSRWNRRLDFVESQVVKKKKKTINIKLCWFHNFSHFDSVS